MSKKLKYIIGSIFFFFSICFLAWNQWLALKKDHPIRFGVVTMLTGPLSAYGEETMNAVRLAVEDINQSGGLSGRTVEAVVEDYGYEPKRAIPAYQSLVARGLSFFILDGSSGIGSIAPLIRENGHMSFVPSSVLPMYEDQNARTCRVALTVKNFAPAMASYLIQTYEKPNVSFLVSQNEYGRGIEEALRGFIEKAGGSVVVSESFAQGSGDFRSQVTKIKFAASSTDALVIINAANTIEPMLQQLKDAGVSLPLVSDLWTIKNPELKTLARAEGAVFVGYEFSEDATSTDPMSIIHFKRGFTERYGKPPSANAANAYDATQLLLKSMEQGKSDPIKAGEYIVHTLKRYQGVGGTVVFNEDCEVDRVLKVYIIKGGKPQVLR